MIKINYAKDYVKRNNLLKGKVKNLLLFFNVVKINVKINIKKSSLKDVYFKLMKIFYQLLYL